MDHTFCSLSYERSYSLPQRVLHIVRSSASSFNLQYPRIFLRSSSCCLCPLLRLPVHSLFFSIFPWIAHFRMQFLGKKWPINLNILNSLWYLIFTQSIQLIFATLLQHGILNFKGISDILSEVPKFQHHAQLCSKYSISVVPSLNLISFCRL